MHFDFLVLVGPRHVSQLGQNPQPGFHPPSFASTLGASLVVGTDADKEEYKNLGFF